MAYRADLHAVPTFIGAANLPYTALQGIQPYPIDPFSFHRTRNPAFYGPQRHPRVADEFHLQTTEGICSG